ncbi:MAG TPA: hypothetical protein VG271_14090, partial [Beijerinckiaceae bacterium]|nr:hypothetical protein [Beijerinckiaceae bacterium]
DLRTGEVVWKSKIGADSMAPVILADGKVIATLGSAHQITKEWRGGYAVVMFKATPEKYAELGRFDPHACHMCSPAIADGKLYVRLLDSIACYDLRDRGIYLKGVSADKDSVTFHFDQSGGGVVAKSQEAMRGITITDGGGTTRPANARINGDDVTIDIKDAPLPASIFAPVDSLVGKNGQPAPAFSWNPCRVLKFHKCTGNAILLSSDQLLEAEDGWGKLKAYSVSGAKVTGVELDPMGKGVKLLTDKTWKEGDAVSVTYASFASEEPSPRTQTIDFTVVAPQTASAKLVKIDATTSGGWRGVYGVDGAVIAGDAAAPAPKYALVAATDKADGSPWAASAKETRYCLKWGNGDARSIIGWKAPDQFDIDIELTDGKPHQVSVYFIDWSNRSTVTAEVHDADTDAVLDTQTLTNFSQGKYVVWNLSGHVKLRVINVNQNENTQAVVGGVFFDTVAAK